MDSQLVFQAKGHALLTTISYKNRPPVHDYVSNQPVVPSEVTPGQTELYFSDRYSCLLKGKVTSSDTQNEIYRISGSGGGSWKKAVEVRYSEGHGET